MSKQWEVRLIKKPVTDDFRDGYFPRFFHYKKDAIKLFFEVVKKGGEASLVKKTK